MKYVLICLILFYCVSSAQAQSKVLDLVSIKIPSTAIGSRIFMYSGAGLDLGTTLYGTNKGIREANPILGQSRGRQVALTIGSVVAVDFATRILARRGHPKLANAFNLIIGGIHFSAGAYNIRAIQTR